MQQRYTDLKNAAAFGRLCVETDKLNNSEYYSQAAAFGRLCVETVLSDDPEKFDEAAAFGRLCVETLVSTFLICFKVSSRLRAAVC